MKPSGDSHDGRGVCWIIIRFDMCRPALRRTARGFGGAQPPCVQNIEHLKIHTLRFYWLAASSGLCQLSACA